MKISKKIFICATLVVLMLVCITAVSAEDNSLNDDGNLLSVDESLDKISSDDGDLIEGPTSDIIYSDNFFDYFDENGYMYDDIPYTSLTFNDTFENLGISKITITSPMEFKGYSDIAVFNNIAFDIMSDNVSLSNVKVNYNATGALFNVSANNVELNGVTVNYEAESDTNAYAVYASDSSDFRLIGSNINFISNSIGTKGYYQHAIELRNCKNVAIRRNTINCELPACDIVWDAGIEGIDHDLVLTIGIQNSENITLMGNVIETKVTGGYGEFPTADSIMADSFRDLKLSENVIVQNDFSKAGKIGYSNTVDLYNFNTASISSNSILVNSTAGVDGLGSAYPIQLSGPYTNLVIDSNALTAISRGPTLGIFSQNLNGHTDITVINNIIDVTGYATNTSIYSLVSGMELQDSEARVYNNTIHSESIGAYGDSYYLYGISYAQWLSNGHLFDIQNNTVRTGGKYAVYLSNAVNSSVVGNDLRAHELFGNASVNIASGTDNVIEANVPPYEAVIIIDNSNAWIGYNKTITVTIPEATGSVNIIVNGREFRGLNLENNSVSVVVDASDIYALNNVSVIYRGDDIVLPGEEKATFKALDGKITNETFSDYFDDEGYLCDFVPVGVALDFNGKFIGDKYSLFINKQVNIITTDDALFDSAKFSIVFGADNTNLTGIRFIDSDILVEGASNIRIVGVDMLSNKSCALTVTSDANTIQNNSIQTASAYAIDLKASLNNLVTGNFLIAGELCGNDAVNYAEGNIVKDNGPVDPKLEVTVADINLGEDAIINISIDDGVDDDVLVVVDAEFYVVPVSAGKGQLNVSDLYASTYTVAVMYKGDEEFAPSTKYAEFTVNVYATQFTDITIENNMITAYLIDETGAAVGNAPIKCIINGVESNATTSSDGKIVITGVANSAVVLIFEGATPLLPTDITINMNVAPSERTATQLFAEDFTQYACDYAAGEKGGYFKVQIKDANGNPLANKTIAVGFNGVVGYYQSDAEGWIQKQIALANAGEYTFASIFLGDENYTASFIVNKITIVKKPTSISASVKSYKASASKKSYTATLKTIAGSSIDGKVYLSAGKKITFTVNGKTYTAKTDSKGKATVNLKLIKKGSYTIKVSFAGDGTYKQSSASAKITIK